MKLINFINISPIAGKKEKKIVIIVQAMLAVQVGLPVKVGNIKVMEGWNKKVRAKGS